MTIEEAACAELIDGKEAAALPAVPDEQRERASQPLNQLDAPPPVTGSNQDVLSRRWRKCELAGQGDAIVEESDDDGQYAVVLAAGLEVVPNS